MNRRRRRRLSATAWHGEMFQSVFSHLITRRRHDVNAGPVSENFKFIYAVQPAQAHSGQHVFFPTHLFTFFIYKL